MKDNEAELYNDVFPFLSFMHTFSDLGIFFYPCEVNRRNEQRKISTDQK
jgi:hypothetical protein